MPEMPSRLCVSTHNVRGEICGRHQGGRLVTNHGNNDTMYLPKYLTNIIHSFYLGRIIITIKGTKIMYNLEVV